MLTREQRKQILKWGGLALFALSLLPILMHGILFTVLLHYYLPLAICLAAIYFGYLKIQEADLTDATIKKIWKQLFTRRDK